MHDTDSRRLFIVAYHPSPQRVAEFNHLAARVDCHVVYCEGSDLRRGWGRPTLEHSHSIVGSDVRAGMATLKTLVSYRPSAVVAFGYRLPPFIASIAWARAAVGTKLAVRCDSSIQRELDTRGPLGVFRKRLLLQILLGRGCAIWASSWSNADYWRMYGLEPETMIPYSSPMPASGPGLASELLWGEASGRRFLYVGRLSPEKGILNLLSAWRQSEESNASGSRLLIVGDGPLREHVSAAVSECWSIEWVGSVSHDNLGAYYQTADVVVVPSVREGWGLVVNEALEFGCYVIASDRVPAAREWLGLSRGRLYNSSRPVVSLAKLLKETHRAELGDVRDFELRVAPEGLVELEAAAINLLGEPQS